MQMKTTRVLALVLLALSVILGRMLRAQPRPESSSYPAMAPVEQYMMPNEDSEVALARSAAPASVADNSEVLVLRRNGYRSAMKGENGFVCLVERSFGAATDAPEFWNPKIRAPICVNAAAARTYLPAVLLKAKLALAGRSKSEIAQAIESATDNKTLPVLEPGAMSYMMSKQQFLQDRGKNWHPHLMWFVAGDAAKSWGADLPGSPVISANDPEDRMTILMVWVNHWSDGTPAPLPAGSHAGH